ncbi:hypothetical protein F4703DRAFT_1794896 [Phycomyces blakesleeanus]
MVYRASPQARVLLLPPVGLFCQWVCCFPLVGPFLLPVDLLSLASGPFHIAVGCRLPVAGCQLPVASCQLPAACFTSTGGSIYLTGRRHLSHWSDICFLLLPVASAGEPDGSISAAKLSAMLCPQDTSSKADKAHQKPNMGACKKATSAHKRGQSMRQSKDQSGPQDRPMLQVRTRERANQPTRKAKVCARRKGQTAPQERPKLQMRAREKKVFQRPSRSLSRFKAKSR